MKPVSVVAFLILTICIGVLGGCGGSGVKTYSKSDTNITAKAGEEFVIELESNKTTGFEWSVVNTLDTSIVKKVESTYVTSDNAKNLVGAGGVEKWTFKAVGKGNTMIMMGYARPFEKNVQPAQVVAFNVTVQ